MAFPDGHRPEDCTCQACQEERRYLAFAAHLRCTPLGRGANESTLRMMFTAVPREEVDTLREELSAIRERLANLEKRAFNLEHGRHTQE